MGLSSMSAIFGRLCLALSLAVSCGKAAVAQQPAAVPEPAFEAVSIRPSHYTVNCYSALPPGGTQYATTCTTLRELIAMAWKTHPDNIQGGDAAALNTLYDVRAVTPGQPWTRKSISPMLRRLLIERFHIAAHPGTKQVTGYALVVAKGGPKLTPAEFEEADREHKAGEGFHNYIMEGHIHSPGANLGTVASLLSSAAHAIVVDQTGISGSFKIDLHYAFGDNSDSNLPDLFIAVQEQLGLKLQPEKVTINTLVIEHTDSEPTAN